MAAADRRRGSDDRADRRARPRGRLAALADFSPAELRLLAPLIAAGFFEQYDIALLTLAAPVISDGLGVGIATFGLGVAVIRLGALGGVPVLRLADRVGRRRMLILSLAGFTLATGLTAAAIGLVMFVALQTVARVFLSTEHALASIVIAEEVRADRRGAALTLLGWISILGPAAVAVLLLVVPYTPLDWRLLYLFALLPLVIVAWLRRSLQETAAFTVAAAQRRIQATLWPRVSARDRPRLVRMGAIIAGAGLVQTTSFLYASELAQDGYGWDALFTVVVLSSGLATFAGFWLGGRASDRIGRKPATAAGILLAGAGPVLIFTEVPALFVPGFFSIAAAYACLQAAVLAYLAELFPTEVRAGLTAFALSCQVVSGSVGLVVVAALEPSVGSSATLVVMGALSLLLVVFLRGLPERAGADVVGAQAP